MPVTQIIFIFLLSFQFHIILCFYSGPVITYRQLPNGLEIHRKKLTISSKAPIDTARQWRESISSFSGKGLATTSKTIIENAQSTVKDRIDYIIYLPSNITSNVNQFRATTKKNFGNTIFSIQNTVDFIIYFPANVSQSVQNKKNSINSSIRSFRDKTLKLIDKTDKKVKFITDLIIFFPSNITANIDNTKAKLLRFYDATNSQVINTKDFIMATPRNIIKTFQNIQVTADQTVSNITTSIQKTKRTVETLPTTITNTQNEIKAQINAASNNLVKTNQLVKMTVQKSIEKVSDTSNVVINLPQKVSTQLKENVQSTITTYNEFIQIPTNALNKWNGWKRNVFMKIDQNLKGVKNTYETIDNKLRGVTGSVQSTASLMQSTVQSKDATVLVTASQGKMEGIMNDWKKLRLQKTFKEKNVLDLYFDAMDGLNAAKVSGISTYEKEKESLKRFQENFEKPKLKGNDVFEVMVQLPTTVPKTIVKQQTETQEKIENLRRSIIETSEKITTTGRQVIELITLNEVRRGWKEYEEEWKLQSNEPFTIKSLVVLRLRKRKFKPGKSPQQLPMDWEEGSMDQDTTDEIVTVNPFPQAMKVKNLGLPLPILNEIPSLKAIDSIKEEVDSFSKRLEKNRVTYGLKKESQLDQSKEKKKSTVNLNETATKLAKVTGQWIVANGKSVLDSYEIPLNESFEKMYQKIMNDTSS